MLFVVEFHDVLSAIAVVALMVMLAVANVKVFIVEKSHGLFSFISCDRPGVGVSRSGGAVVTEFFPSH